MTTAAALAGGGAGALAGMIPNIQGFQPLGTAAIIPFMELQTRVMGLAFGSSMQIGKRWVGSLSNEEFNSMVEGGNYVKVGDKKFNIDQQIEAQRKLGNKFGVKIWEAMEPMVKSAIEDFNKQLPLYDEIQDTIIDKGFDLEQDKMVKNAELFQWFATNFPNLLAVALGGGNPELIGRGDFETGSKSGSKEKDRQTDTGKSTPSGRSRQGGSKPSTPKSDPNENIGRTPTQPSRYEFSFRDVEWRNSSVYGSTKSVEVEKVKTVKMSVGEARSFAVSTERAMNQYLKAGNMFKANIYKKKLYNFRKDFHTASGVWV